jgi:hypothetical protein
MQVKAQVVGERREEFDGRRGEGVNHILLCVDCDIRTPLTNLFEYVMTREEAAEYFGRLRDKIVMLGISELQPIFGGQFRAMGDLIVVSALKPPEVKK